MELEKGVLNVENLRVRILFRQSRSAQVVGLMNFLIYAYLGMDILGHRAPGFITVLAVMVSYGRWLLQRRFHERFDQSPDGLQPLLWENLFAAGTAGMGLLWGLAGVLVPGNAIVEQAFLAFVLAGTTAGATVAYCTSYRAIVAFLLAAVLPFALNMLVFGGAVQIAMGAMMLIYVIVLSSLTRHMSATVAQSIGLRFEKDQALTDLEAARNTFAHSTKMAALGEMAGGIAHEINNPLAIIRANAGVVRRLVEVEDVNRAKVTEIAEKIDVTVDRIAKIVAGLRTFSREAGNDPLEDVSARELIEQTLEFCEARFRSRGIPLRIELPEGDVRLSCRRVQISQVLLNLLNNAFDAVKDVRDPWVQVRADREHGHLVIAVSDSGPGVRADLREKIMQPFFTTKKVGEGTGLGLSIAHGIMAGHGGALRLDTEAVNTRFVMDFGPSKVRCEELAAPSEPLAA